ncbi:hypothetical protein [Streptomyces sp. NPDC059894]|uniref:hypothetical protein n=1 Tax=unclassified Streptomyces TaxID=2593676 RepID=UPI00365DC7FE
MIDVIAFTYRTDCPGMDSRARGLVTALGVITRASRHATRYLTTNQRTRPTHRRM